MQLGVQCKDEKEDSAIVMIEKIIPTLLTNNTLQSLHLCNNSFSKQALGRLKWLMSIEEPGQNAARCPPKPKVPEFSFASPTQSPLPATPKGEEDELSNKEDVEFDEKDRIINPFDTGKEELKIRVYNQEELENEVLKEVAKDKRSSPLQSPKTSKATINNAKTKLYSNLEMNLVNFQDKKDLKVLQSNTLRLS